MAPAFPAPSKRTASHALKITDPGSALEQGIGLIPEDRKNQGVLLGLSVKENVTFSSLKQAMVGPFVDDRKDAKIADEYIKKLRIKTPSVHQLVKNLSGGNQQKVLVGKWMFSLPDIMMLDEPTRGVDVGAKYEIYSIINQLVGEGKAVLMISSELPELLGMCDRIYVMVEGRMVGELTREQATQEIIMDMIMQASKGAQTT